MSSCRLSYDSVFKTILKTLKCVIIFLVFTNSNIFAATNGNETDLTEYEYNHEDFMNMTIDIPGWKEDYFCVTNTLEILCSVNQLLFTPDLQLIVGYKNGTGGSTVGMVLNSSMSMESGYIQYHWTVNVTSVDITSYICLAALIKSTQKMSLTIEVKVLYAQPPNIQTSIFDPTTSSNEVFYDNDVDQTLICVADGIPTPDITWSRNNIEISKNDSKWKFEDITEHGYGNMSIKTSTLYIRKVSDVMEELPGIWTCNATNGFQPDASYKINVKIYQTFWIWMVIFIIVCAVLVLWSYLWHKYWKEMEIVQIRRQFLYGDGNKITSLQLRLRELGSNGYSEVKIMEDISHATALAIGFSKEKLLNPDDITQNPNQKLGSGRFGDVIGGIFKKPNGERIEVAIKTPKTSADPSQNKQNQEVLVEELKMLSYVGEHEYIVRLIGAVIISNTIEEKIQGVLEMCLTSLYDHLRLHGNNFIISNSSPENMRSGYEVSTISISTFESLKTPDLIRWSFQIACGMQHLASRKIVHRDLAARNILLVNKNGQLDVRIADFGLSQKLSERDKSYVTEWGRKPLPWRYLAPELLDKTLTFSESTDVWSFGITMWEIFTLAENVPYHIFSDADAHFMNAIKNKHARNSKPEFADFAIYEIMCQCWDQEPNNRPTFKVLTQQLLAILPSEVSDAVPGTAFTDSNEERCLYYIRHLLFESDRSMPWYLRCKRLWNSFGLC